METTGLGAGSYPEPLKTKFKRASGNILVQYSFKEDFPLSISNDEIEDYLEESVNLYKPTDISIEDITIEEIEEE